MKKIKKRLLALSASLIVLACSSYFLFNTCKYILFSYRICSIENEGYAGYYAKNGRVVWSDSLIKAYEEEFKNKQVFIKSNDIAKFLYYSGYSITGMVIRFLAFIGNIVIFMIFLIRIWNLIKYIITYFIRFCKSRLIKRS